MCTVLLPPGDNRIPIYILQDANLHSLHLETALHVSDSTSTHHQKRARARARVCVCVCVCSCVGVLVICILYSDLGSS
jgi:hypothetical protein